MLGEMGDVYVAQRAFGGACAMYAKAEGMLRRVRGDHPHKVTCPRLGDVFR